MPGDFPELSDGEAMSLTAAEIWKAVPIVAPKRRSASTCSGAHPENMPPYRPEVAISEPVFSAMTAR